jgi:hypothetical protein
MKKYFPILDFPLMFGFGYSIPEVFKGNLVWLFMFIPGLVYTVIRIYKLFKD